MDHLIRGAEGLLKGMVQAGALTVLMITHKFREVMAFADRVSVLRRGKLAGAGEVADLDAGALTEMMIGRREIPAVEARRGPTPGTGEVRLLVERLTVHNDGGLPAVHDLSVQVRARALTLTDAFAEAGFVIPPNSYMDWDQVAQALVMGFSQTFNIHFETQNLSASEHFQAQNLYEQVYGTSAWSRRR